MNPARPPISLSEAQREVVETRGRHLQVIACAGSGKTESVSRRVAELIREGVASHEIVAFTFTERAAAELKDRIARRVAEIAGPEAAGRLAQMYVGTIHGYCLRLLQLHVPRFGNADVLDEHRHAAMLFRFRKEIGVTGLKDRVWESVREFARTVDVISNEGLSAEAIDRTDFGPLYRNYLGVLDRLHVLTYGRIVQCAVETLEAPALAAAIAGPLKHLIVDEYQDINPSQDRLIRLLASHGAEVCAVGDDDQAIYQWRGSDVSFLQAFPRNFPGARTVVLDENRRSLAPIVHGARGFVGTVRQRLEKLMRPVRGHDGQAIVHFRTPTADAEAEAVADTIVALRERGVRAGDIALLFRSVRTSTRPFIDALRDRGIPFTCGGRSGLFLQPEVQAVVKAHLWLGDTTWWDDETRTEVALEPADLAREFADAFGSSQPLEEIEGLLNDWRSLVERPSGPANLIDDLYRLLEFLGVDRWNPDDPATLPRLGSLARFSTVLADFEHVTRRGRYETDETNETNETNESSARVFRGGTDRGIEYYRRLSGYLRYYAQEAYEEFEGEDGAGVDAVQILTVHGAKGLEWPVVFLPSLQDRRFPASRAGRDLDWSLPDTALDPAVKARYAGGEEEERRLFYVAMTRARDLLYVSHFERTEQRASRRSRFLDDLHRSPLPEWTGPVIPHAAAAATAAEKPVSLSLSELIRYEECGYRYRLQRVIGFETQLASELGFGRAIHHVLRRIADEARTTGRIPDVSEIDALLDRELYFPYANRSSEPPLRQKARNLVVRYLNRHRDDFLRVWATERPFELHLPQGFLTGRADVILDREGGRPDRLAIVDYKSGSDGRGDEQFAFQLQVYAAAARAEGLDVAAAYVHDLSAGQAARREIAVGEEETRKALEKAEERAEGLRRREFPARPEVGKCGRCEYRQICRSRAG